MPPPLQVTLYLPSLKGHDLTRYDEWMTKGPLAHRVGRPRDTGQLTRWNSLMPGRIKDPVKQRAQHLGLTMEDVIRPYWSKSTVLNRRMAVDHIVEIQVAPIGREGQLDLMPNYRLMDSGQNSSVGAELSANIQTLRETLAKESDNDIWLRCDLTFDNLVARGAISALTWTKEQLQNGEQLDAFVRLGRPPKPP